MNNREKFWLKFLFSGQAYIVCGDDKGRLWTYHVANLQKNSFQNGKPVQPTEVTVSPKCPATSQLCFHKLLSGNALIIFCVCNTLTKLIAVISEHSGITKKTSQWKNKHLSVYRLPNAKFCFKYCIYHCCKCTVFQYNKR